MLRLNNCAPSGKAFHMSEDKNGKLSREERMAAKLRENLRRRKAQGRELKSESSQNGLPKGGDES
jgi:hypothetical protein